MFALSVTTQVEDNDQRNTMTMIKMEGDKFMSFIYMSIFFLAMISHEVALEYASKKFSHINSFATIVTLFQFGSCFILPFIISCGEVRHTFPKSKIEYFRYVQLSIAVFGATTLATHSLKYVSYPTKVIFKSAKLIPTMIVSTFMNRGTSYKWLDYLAATFLCLGAAGYAYDTGSTSEVSDSYIGIVLLLCSILCDSIVPNFQQRLMQSNDTKHTSSLPTNNNNSSSTNSKETPNNNNNGLSALALMFNMNSIGFITLLFYLVLSRSQISISPLFLFYLSLIGLSLSTAVLAYTKLIKMSGSVLAVTVSTLRKVATVFLSYIIFPKQLLPIHFVSGLFVLVGLILNSKLVKK